MTAAPHSHPVVAHPKLHCGVCEAPLLFPRKIVLTPAGATEDGKTVDKLLAECAHCAVAVEVPVGYLQHARPVSLPRVEARPRPVRAVTPGG